jgi:transcription antitermination factor NusG
MQPSPDLDWFALTVPPQREFAAVADLAGQSLTALAPVRQTWRRISRHVKRRELVSAPLLTGYVFLGVKGRLPWAKLRSIKTVRGVVKFNDAPAKVDHRQLSTLVELAAQMSPPEDDSKPPVFTKGEIVNIVNGLMTGTRAPIEAILGKRAVLAVGNQKITVPLTVLAKQKQENTCVSR